MKAYVTFQGSDSIEEIDISLFETLTDVLDGQPSQLDDPIPIPFIKNQEFEPYQEFMGSGPDLEPELPLEDFYFSFLTIGNYLYDRRFSQLTDWVRRQILLGKLRIDQKNKSTQIDQLETYELSEAYLDIIFYPLSQKIYQLEELVQFLELNNIDNSSWTRIYRFFPLAEAEGLDWKVPLLIQAYGLTLQDLRLSQTPTVWFRLSSCFMMLYLKWVISADINRLLQYLIDNFNLSWKNAIRDSFIISHLMKKGSLRLIDLVIKSLKISKGDLLESHKMIFGQAIYSRRQDLKNYFQSEFKINRRDYVRFLRSHLNCLELNDPSYSRQSDSLGIILNEICKATTQEEHSKALRILSEIYNIRAKEEHLDQLKILGGICGLTSDEDCLDTLRILAEIYDFK